MTVVHRNIIHGIQGREGVPGPAGPTGPAGQNGEMSGPDVATEGNFAIFGATPSDLEDGGVSLAAHMATVDTLNNETVKRDGSVAMTGDLNLNSHKIAGVANPELASDGVNRAYVDAFAIGVIPHNPVRFVAIAGTLATDFDNGKSAGGVTVATGDRFGYFPAGGAVNAGVYTAAASGAPTRATDLDVGAEFTPRASVAVTAGTYAGTRWQCTNVAEPVVGVDVIVFTEAEVGGQTYTGNAGVLQVGNNFSLDLSYSAIWTAAQAIRISAAGVALTLTSTNAGSATGPDLDLFRDSASPAANDILSSVLFNGKDSAGNKTAYASILTQILDPVDATEDAKVVFGSLLAGTFATRLSYGAGLWMAGATGGDQGVGTINVTAAYDDGVQLITPDTTFLTTNATTNRSARQRWSDTVNVMDWGADPTGVTANFHTALANALAEAQARTRSEVRVPPGLFKRAGTVAIVSAAQKIAIIGHERSTVIGSTEGVLPWFTVGAAGSPAITEKITLANMEMICSVPQTASSIFKWRNVQGCQLFNVRCSAVRQAHDFGGVNAGEFAGQIDFIDSPIACDTDPAHAAVPIILLGYGGSLNIRGAGKHNGGNSSRTFIAQNATTQNFDAIYIYDQFFEQWSRYIDVTGQGITNLIWSGGQIDRPDTVAFKAAPAVGGQCRTWSIRGVQMNFNQSDAVSSNPVDWGGGSAGTCRELMFANNQLFGASSYVYIRNGTEAAIVGNTFKGCGRGTGGGGSSLIRFAGKGCVTGNLGSTYPGITAPVHAINWENGPIGAPERSTSGNSWIGVSGLVELGTV